MSDTLPLFVGTYTQMITPEFGGNGEGIHSMILNTQTGELQHQHSYPCTNPSYLALSPCRSHLYAINEVDQNEQPQVIGFQIQADLSLTKNSTQTIEGSYPCHIEYFQDSVLVACYGSGNLACFGVNQSGELLPSYANLLHQGSSVNAQRQEGPHAHQAYPHPTKSLVFVADLGIDQVKAYRIESGKISSQESDDLTLSAGGGPRHVVLTKDGNKAFVLNELTGVVSGFEATGTGYVLSCEVASLPEEFSAEPSASALRIHPNGQYLYAGNRNFEAITIFQITDQGLVLKGYIPTGGKTLREFNLSPDGNWLIAAHQDSHNLVVYRLLDNGLVLKKQSEYSLQSPVCIRF